MYGKRDVKEQWESIKREITSFCQAESKKIAQNKHKEKSNLEYMALMLEEDLIAGRETGTNVEKIGNALDEVNSKIAELEMERCRAAAFRARARWVRDGEKNTKYFFALEKRNAESKLMRKLIVDGRTLTEQGSILKAQQHFYQTLYTSNTEVFFDIPNNSGVKITDIQKNQMEAQITMLECGEALRSMKNDKAPGNDGLTVNFFKVFWPVLKDLLLLLYREVITSGELNSSARKGVITLIPKKKDLTQLKNWRPITLLNMDYKILGKVIARRLKQVLPDIIGPQQTGFMEGRNITENIRGTIDLITHVYQNQKDALIISVDYEKCFDRIEYQAVQGALKYFGFSNRFAKMTNIFFNNFQICTSNAGFFSDFFAKSRGVNQGCLVSPYLFLLCSEVMAHKIKENVNITGIQMGNRNYVISQFADDTLIYIKYEKISLAATIETLAYIETNTGLKISYEKSVVYRIGSIRDSDAQLYTQKQLQWSSGDIDTLGVTIRNAITQTTEVYNQCIWKMEAVADQWYYRQFSLKGKVLIMNSLMASIFVYKLTVFSQYVTETSERD